MKSPRVIFFLSEVSISAMSRRCRRRAPPLRVMEVHGAPRTGGADYLAHMEFNSFASEVRQNLYHTLEKT
jgi:hypothetical protein